jgi:hypothetical protein
MAVMSSTASAQELKDAWPKFLAQCQQAARPKPIDPLPMVLNVRCGLLLELKGPQPTDRMFEVMAQFPFDGSVSKDELLNQLSS